MTHAPRRFPASLALLLGLGACEPKPTPGDPAPAPPSAPAAAPSPESTASAAPQNTASAAPAPSPENSASAAPAPSAAAKANCYPAAKSRDYGSVSAAEPPFADCAKHLKVHCGGKDGERGHLTGLALDVKATTAARKRQPDACCYNSCD
ncbi:MAG: hypothetical protein AMXMBFR56_30290 [Polyangiaceae bacterium]